MPNQSVRGIMHCCRHAARKKKWHRCRPFPLQPVPGGCAPPGTKLLPSVCIRIKRKQRK
jgi:hypothetical protein